MHNLQLKKLRKQAGYKTQADLAQALHMNPRTYASWEREEVSLSLEDALRIADLLGCSLDELSNRRYARNRYADKRQEQINQLYTQLDEARKSFVLESMQGLVAASLHTMK